MALPEKSYTLDHETHLAVALAFADRVKLLRRDRAEAIALGLLENSAYWYQRLCEAKAAARALNVGLVVR